MSRFAPRLHVLIARAANYAIVIRRGPSKQVCTIGWDMNSNEFELGQWMKGRIYERRCDLSPDGKYMIYFAMNGKWASETAGSWTAISKTPYLKALGLWPKGDCWLGGGLFLSDSTYWLNHPYDPRKPLHIPCDLKRIEYIPYSGDYGAECLSVYYPKLQMDGWTLKHYEKTIAIFEKQLKHNWLLKKIGKSTIDPPKGKGCYFDEHELYNAFTKTSIECTGWEWADFKDGHLYWTAKGILYSGLIEENGLCDIKDLYDFNNMTFKPFEAPY